MNPFNPLRSFFRSTLLRFTSIGLSISNVLPGSVNESVRALILHDIAPDQIGKLRDLFFLLSKNYDFLSPNEFFAYMHGSLQLKRPSLIVTFDDGLSSTYYVCRFILEPLNIYSFIFLCADTFGLKNLSQEHTFISHNLQRLKPVLPLQSNRLFLSSSQVRELISEGHTIGSHTLSHLRLNTLDNSLLHNEIVHSADLLQQYFDVAINAFAYPFGDIDSFSYAAMNIACKRFRYVFSGVRGSNTSCRERHILFRDSINIDEPLSYSKSILEGCLDFSYRNARSLLLHWDQRSELL